MIKICTENIPYLHNDINTYMPRTGPRPHARGPRPHIWITGPDPERHRRFVAWARARAQAHYRGEIWQLTFEEWEEAWGDLWSRRGRGRDDLMLGRQDWHAPWRLNNVHVITRTEFFEKQSRRKQELREQRAAARRAREEAESDG